MCQESNNDYGFRVSGRKSWFPVTPLSVAVTVPESSRLGACQNIKLFAALVAVAGAGERG